MMNTEMDDDDIGPFMAGQKKSLAIVSVFTGLLSMAGSFCILYIIGTTKGRERTYDRLLLGFSVFDLISSLFLALSFLMRPKEADFSWFRGNEISCTVAGAMTHLSMACAAYSTSLSFYFLLHIRYQTPQKTIQNYYEPLMHLISIALPVSTSIIGASTGMFNPIPSGITCWFAESPPGCTGSECERGALAWLGRLTMALIPVVLMFLAVLINYFLIFQSVRRQNKRNLRYVVEGDDHQIKQAKKIQRATAVQALLYSTIFLNTFMWGFIQEFYRAATGNSLFGLSVLWTMFYRLQGFFNFFIYIRPKYLRWRKNYPEKSRLWAMRQCIFWANKSPRRPQPQQQPDQHQKQQSLDADVSNEPTATVPLGNQESYETNINTDSSCSNLCEEEKIPY